MTVADYVGNKCNFTSKITDLEKELTGCHINIESLSEQQAQFEQHPLFGEQSLVDDNYVHFTLDCPMPWF